MQARERGLPGWSLAEPLHRELAPHDQVVEQDRFLGREVSEDGAAAHTRGGCDLIDGGFRVAITSEELQCRLGDPCPRCFSLAVADRSLTHSGSAYDPNRHILAR